MCQDWESNLGSLALELGMLPTVLQGLVKTML